jgi:hypothetical protein
MPTSPPSEEQFTIAQVHGDDAIEIFGERVGDLGGRHLDARVVVSRVESTEGCDGFFDQRIHLRLVGNVAAHGEHAMSGGRQRFRCRK